MAHTITDVYKRLILASTDYSLEADYPDNETYIYANSCIMSQNVKAQTLSLHTDSFSTISSDLTIDISGKPGKDNKTAGESKANGEPGKTLSFSSANFNATQSICILARGGDGGNGFSCLASDQVGDGSESNGGDGGDGGDGGHIQLIYNDTFRVAYMACRTYYKSKKESDLVEWVRFLQTTVTYPDSLVEKIKAFQESSTKLSASDLGASVQSLLDALDNASADFSSAISSRMGYNGGAYGLGGLGTLRNGRNGSPGRVGSATLNRNMREDDIRNSREILLHPDQVAMTLRDIGIDYFLGSPESLLRCARTLRVTINRLEFLDNLEPGDALFKAYADGEANLFVLPSGTSTPTSIVSLRHSLTQARRYMAQMSRNLDIYCHVPSWVPRGSHALYQQQLGEVLKDFGDIEENYFAYKNQASSQTKKRGAIRRSLAAAESLISHATSELSRLGIEQDAAAKMIASYSPSLGSKRNALKNEIEKLEDDIKEYNDVSFSDFIDAAAQFAFAPGLAMGAIQAARLFYDAKTTISDGFDMNIRKDYLVEEVKAISADMDGLKEGLKLGTGGATLTIDDPGAAKLLVEEDKLKSLIRQYRDLIKDMNDVVAAFDAYIDLVIKRNNEVMQYNALVVQQLQAQIVVITQQHQAKILNQAKLDEIDPSLPMIAVSVQQSYFHTVDQVLKLLYRAERALTFWTLSQAPSKLNTLRAGGFERRGLSQELASTRDNILTAYSDAVERATSLSQKFESIRLDLSHSQLAELKDNNRTYVTIIAADSATPVWKSPFANCADVRLERVRLYLEGATTADEVLMVTLTHIGSETMVDTDDLTHLFSHNQVTLKFKYNYATGAIDTDGDVRGILAGEYALPGPFTTWIVEVNDDYNRNLDLSHVSRAWFDFSGWSRSF